MSPPATPATPATPGVLFTAFEPSGDQAAAPVIARIRALRPDLPIFALGGAKMQEAGATILETTGHRAAVMDAALSQAREHLRRVKRLKAWLREHPLATLVPVDSPAANWGICKAVRKIQPKARIVHLVAPQLWAWAGWRIRKLRRLTDHVLCILPFEPDWFSQRGVKATFVGHPLYAQIRPGGGEHDEPNAARVARVMGPLAPHAGLKLALLPGSRGGEHRANWPTMLRAFLELSKRHPDLCGAIAAVDDAAVKRLAAISCKGCAPRGGESIDAKRAGGGDEPAWWPSNLHVRVGAVNEVLAWCDAVLVVSGTATLHTAIHEKPMVVLYNLPRWKWYSLGHLLIRTRTFAIPNLIVEARGEPRVVKEFVPHFWKVPPVVEAVDALLSSEETRKEQVASLRKINALFQPPRFAELAAQEILRAATSK